MKSIEEIISLHLVFKNEIFFYYKVKQNVLNFFHNSNTDYEASLKRVF